jgi:hypothetical protein
MSDFIRNNYEAVNEAVDQEALRQQALLSYYKDGDRVLKSQVIKNCLIGGAVIIVAVAIVVWLFFVKNNGPQFISNPEISGNKDALEQLILNSKPSIENEPFTHSSFTVFHTTSLENGKEVVTGHIYQKSDLEHPYRQYCYYAEDDNDKEYSKKNITLADRKKFGVKGFQITNEKFIQYLKSCNFRDY